MKKKKLSIEVDGTSFFLLSFIFPIFLKSFPPLQTIKQAPKDLGSLIREIFLGETIS